MSHRSTWRTPAVLAACALAAPLVAHDDDPKLLDKQPAVLGTGWTASDTGPTPFTSSQLGFTSSGVQLMAWLTSTDLGVPGAGGNDCWGYTHPVSGREYAIMCTTTNTVFVEVTNPGSPVVIDSIDGPNSTWRDAKVYNDHCYIVSEGGGGIQCVSLANIDNGSVQLVGTAGGGSTHNIAIDTTSGYAYRTGGGSNGLRIYDLNANPANPPFVGDWQDRYVHDAQVVTYTSGPLAGQQLAFCCGGLSGGGTDTALSVVNVTNKNNPVVLSTTPYPNRDYSHQGWLSEDRQYFFLNDELDEPPLDSTTYVFDVSDPSNVSYATSFDNNNPSVTHNAYVKDNLLYSANYRSGMRVFDVSNPLNATEIAWFDTYPANDNANFNGLWSLFPYFDSGTVIGSDTERGLFVWRVTTESLSVSVPGPPAVLDPAGETVAVTISEGSPGDLMAGSELLNYDTGSGFLATPLIDNGGGNYTAQFPPIPCGTAVSWYVSAQTISGVTFTAPGGAPGTTYDSLSANGTNNLASYDMESTSSWSVGFPGDDASTGVWVRVNPNGTAAQPEDDHTPAGTQCWVTGQGSVGGSIGENDVDNGRTTLLSPILDLSGAVDPTISYWRWYVNNGNNTVDDVFEVLITDDGSSWSSVETIGPAPSSGGWNNFSFRVLDIPGISLTNQIRLRFVASDEGGGSIVEAGIDDLTVDDVICDTGIGSPYCDVVFNSLGLQGALTASGSNVVNDNDVTLEATDLPQNQFGYFLASQSQAFITNVPGSVGNLCLGTPIGRYVQQVQSSGAQGAFSVMIDLTNIPLSPPVAAQPGQTWNFQAWYRDNLGFQTSNFTNGYSILFQ